MRPRTNLFPGVSLEDVAGVIPAVCHPLCISVLIQKNQLSTCELISSQNGKDAASLGSVMTTNSSISSSPTRARSKKHVKTKPIFGRSYKTIQSEVRIEQLKSEIEALKPQTVKRLI